MAARRSARATLKQGKTVDARVREATVDVCSGRTEDGGAYPQPPTLSGLRSFRLCPSLRQDIRETAHLILRELLRREGSDDAWAVVDSVRLARIFEDELEGPFNEPQEP